VLKNAKDVLARQDGQQKVSASAQANIRNLVIQGRIAEVLMGQTRD